MKFRLTYKKKYLEFCLSCVSVSVKLLFDLVGPQFFLNNDLKYKLKGKPITNYFISVYYIQFISSCHLF